MVWIYVGYGVLMCYVVYYFGLLVMDDIKVLSMYYVRVVVFECVVDFSWYYYFGEWKCWSIGEILVD